MDFIEFAVDESEHQQLASFLQKTGFTHVATHKVKQVELWQQGGIRLVINRESQSFAQRYHTEQSQLHPYNRLNRAITPNGEICRPEWPHTLKGYTCSHEGGHHAGYRQCRNTRRSDRTACVTLEVGGYEL